jgi:hypothetical protein
MPQIFLSYAREDQGNVQTLISALTDSGLSVFWDRQIPAGETWRGYIGRALGEAQCVIVVWSTAALASNWVMEEAEEAKQRAVLIPVLIDPVQPPIGFRTIQAADLIRWNGDAASAQFQQLLVDVRRMVGQGVDRAPSPSTLESEARKAVGRLGRRTPTLWTAGYGLAAVALLVAGFFLIAQWQRASPSVENQQPQSATPTVNQVDSGPPLGSLTTLDRFKQLRDYAYSSAGLDLDGAGASAWAEARLRESPDYDLAKFRELQQWAYSSAGLDLSKSESQEWAEQRMRESPPLDFENFKKAYEYAYSSGGLNLSREAAAAWALKTAKR